MCFTTFIFCPLSFTFYQIWYMWYMKRRKWYLRLISRPKLTSTHGIFCHVVVWMLLETMCKELGSGLQNFRYPMTWVDISFGREIRRMYDFRLFIYHKYQI